MISRFFIDRPIFAAVLSIFITLTGGIALLSLPLAQYPPVTPPAVAVLINYPGASAQVVADTVAAPIEQQVNGVEGMLYMSSQMGNDGSYTLTVTFDIGTNLNTALVMVQNRVQLALPLLPPSVQNQGITIRKKTPDILNIINFYSPDGRYDALYLSNYATIHVQVERRGRPGIEARLDDLQGLPLHAHVVPGVRDALLVSSILRVIRGHVAQQGNQGGVVVLDRGVQAVGVIFDRPPEPAPEVEFPGQVEPVIPQAEEPLLNE